ncbi:hypothetical protein Hbl1158_13625 [Halobaculum sp. CBA1158]|uniref:hypothetical protein n=1 Tax=Halobaculum sp. CBA1158 TaxID=2904243 RepID=UPI001F46CC08|nr:hypothetical protein [Halobaculum sp. CBA1158]UIO99548.1 hypothetical protein Hbl1158_13625 [Halobaculum sp. CBA1158]
MGGTHANLPLALGPAFVVLGVGVLVLALATYDAYRSYDAADAVDGAAGEVGGTTGGVNDTSGGGVDE